MNLHLQRLISNASINVYNFSKHIGRDQSWIYRAKCDDEIIIYGLLGMMNDVAILYNNVETKNIDLLYHRLKIIGFFSGKIIRRTITAKTNDYDYIVNKINKGELMENFKKELIMICNYIILYLTEIHKEHEPNACVS